MVARFAGLDLEIEPPSNCVVCVCSMKLFCLWLKFCKVLHTRFVQIVSGLEL